MTSTQPPEPYPTTQPVEGQSAGGEGATRPPPPPPPPPAPLKSSVVNPAYAYGSSPYSSSPVPGPYSQCSNLSPTMQMAPCSPYMFPPSQMPGQMSPFGPMYGQSMQQPFQGMPFPGFPGLPAGPGYPCPSQGKKLKKGKTYKGDGINICIADSALKPQCPEQKVEQCSCCKPSKPKCKPKKKVQQQPICLLHDYCVLKRLREGCKDFETLGQPPQKRKTVYKIIYECKNKNKKKRKHTRGNCECNEDEKQEKNARDILAKLQALCLMYKFCQMIALREKEDKKSVTSTSCVCEPRKSVDKKDKNKKGKDKDREEKDKDESDKEKKEKDKREKDKEKAKEEKVKEEKGKKATEAKGGKDKGKEVKKESKPEKTSEKKEEKQKDKEKNDTTTNPAPAEPTQPPTTETEATEGQMEPTAAAEETLEPVPPEEGNQPGEENQEQPEQLEEQP